MGWEVVTWERGWGGVGWEVVAYLGGKVPTKEILTYTFAVGQSCVANSSCTLSTNLD